MPESSQRHIVIGGNIGVGKSTLVALLAEQLGWAPVYEFEGTYPYLDDYYADPQRWGFHTQIWFLTRRLLAGIQARLVSSSYTPAPGQPGHDEMLEALAAIFTQHQVDGHVHLDYDTLVFYGQL